MFKRVRRLIALSKLDPKAIESLTEEQIGKIPEVEVGDGKSVFFGEPTPEEQLEFEREEQGTKPWYDRLKKLI